jgi:hypothetical protein
MKTSNAGNGSGGSDAAPETSMFQIGRIWEASQKPDRPQADPGGGCETGGGQGPLWLARGRSKSLLTARALPGKISKKKLSDRKERDRGRRFVHEPTFTETGVGCSGASGSANLVVLPPAGQALAPRSNITAFCGPEASHGNRHHCYSASRSLPNAPRLALQAQRRGWCPSPLTLAMKSLQTATERAKALGTATSTLDLGHPPLACSLWPHSAC